MEETLSSTSAEASQPFVRQWNHLVSTTNWEKGRIIFQWRQALQESGAPAKDSSDDAWSQRVGGVSPQHVGRLRRVWERFGAVYEEYPGLYWSHFQSALEWDDAEMWLEGGVQNGWSVSQMRGARWEAVGGPPELKPTDDDILVGEASWEDEEGQTPAEMDAPGANIAEVQGVADHEAGAGSERRASNQAPRVAAATAADPATEPAARVRPFENLPNLPSDLADALEAFKLAILRHRIAGWQDVSPEDVVAGLQALVVLVESPPEDPS